jgi:Dolichyl-phosphate-mannose-protein mannosyltransferase
MTGVRPASRDHPADSSQDDGSTLGELFSPKSDVFTIFALPIVILLLDHQWIFPGPQRDPWIYFGYFKAAPEWARAFPGAYYGTRLSVIVPGFLLHHLLPSMAANVALHLALAWLALLSFYGVARALFGRPTALLSTICLGCQPFFLAAVGENYVDGFGIAYFLAALLAATQAARRRGTLSLVVAGALSAAVVTANLFYVIYLPLIAFHFLISNRAGARRPLLPSLTAATAGTMGTFAAFCVTNKLLGGRFLYLIPSLTIASALLKTANPSSTPPGVWLPLAVWLVFPGLVLIGALATLISLRTRPPGRRPDNLFYTQLLFLGFLALLPACLPQAPGIVFQWWYYASLMIPVAALAFAGQLSLWQDHVPARSVRFAQGAAVVLVLAYALRTPAGVRSLHVFPALVPLLAGVPALAVIVARVTGNPARLVFVASLALSSVAARDLFPHHAGFDRYGGERAALFAQMDRSVKAYRRFESSGDLYFWFDQEEHSGLLYDLVMATSLSGARVVSVGFPVLLPGGATPSGRRIGPGMRIVVLSSRLSALTEAEWALQSLGLHAWLRSEEKIDGPAGAFSMLFIEVTA